MDIYFSLVPEINTSAKHTSSHVNLMVILYSLHVAYVDYIIKKFQIYIQNIFTYETLGFL